MMCLGTVYSWSVFRLPIERVYNIGTSQSGYPYMFSLAFYSLFVLITGRYIERYSPRVIISLGGLLVGIGWILSSFASNIYILTISYGIITGAGVGVVYGVPMNVIAKWFPEKKGLVVGLVLVGFGLSPFVTAPLASYCVVTYGVKNAFLILGIAFAIIIPLLSIVIKYPPDVKENLNNKVIEINNVNTKEMIKTRSFKGLYLSFIFGTMVGLMIIGITSNVGVELIKLSEKTVVTSMSLFAVFNGVGRVSFGWITDKFSYKISMAISYMLIIFATVLMLMADEGCISLYIISFCIFWFNLGGWLAIAPTATINLYGTKHYSENYGVVFTAYGIGAIIGVVGSGMLKDIFQSYNVIFYFIIAICVMGLISSQKIIKA